MNYNFYSDLPPCGRFNDLADLSHYNALPDDWCLAITDVRQSTLAVEKGQYKAVNMAGASVIAAFQNHFSDYRFPCQFTGDGAIIAFPETLRHRADNILLGCRMIAKQRFGLKLAAGTVSAKKLKEKGLTVSVAKFQTSRYADQAAFRGEGILYAEEQIKQNSLPLAECSAQDIPEVDISGLECRWKPFPAHQKAASLIVRAESEDTYRNVLGLIESHLGSCDDFHPIRKKDMKLSLNPRQLREEIRMRSENSVLSRFRYSLSLYTLQVAGKFLMGRNVTTNYTRWGEYKPDFIQNSDYRKFGPWLMMVVSGSEQNLARLENDLNHLFHDGKIAFGMHLSDATISTCYVTQYQSRHIHFIDGAGGGYTRASEDFKTRLRKLKKSGRMRMIPETNSFSDM
jgi:hypothetical protein